MLNKIKIIVLSAYLIAVTTSAHAAMHEPSLRIEIDKKTVTFTRSQLLSMKEITSVRINNNRAYPGVDMTYTAIKLCDLLKPYRIHSKTMLEFIAADQFAVLIPAKKIMQCGKNDAIGYLAIEPKKKWPIIKNNTDTTAGPFDVIWVNPEKSYISDEYWAWSTIKIVGHDKLDPNKFVTPPKVDDPTIRKQVINGYDIYISHCAGCHTMNNIGKGQIRPDLNIPKNPTEYYPDDRVLKKFIRNPQSIRKIKNDRMSGSSEQFLSEKDLNDLLIYFHYMAKNKSQ